MKISLKSSVVQQFRVIINLVGESESSSKWFDSVEEAKDWAANSRWGKAAESHKIITRLHTVEAFPAADLLQRFAW
jgi:hypothetical protein